MSLDNPQSGLSTETLGNLTDWNRAQADELDAALAEAAAGGGESMTFTADTTGATDVSADLEAAIAAAADASLPLTVPAGTYLLSSRVTISDSDVKIVGQGSPTFVFSSLTREAVALASGARNVTLEGLTFQGDDNDDVNLNLYTAILVPDDVIGVTILNCTFEKCVPLQANDSYKSKRLKFLFNYVHNAPGGLHAPSHSLIEGNTFACDEVVDTRGQAIYIYGQQVGINISNNFFENIANESIQIRASSARFLHRHSFRIIGNQFDGCAHYGIWIGSDDHPDIGEAIITGNTFRNVNGCIMAQGLRSGVITGNHCDYDWEWPHALPGATAIQVEGAPGLPGHYNTARGVIVANNKVHVHHPWVGKVTIDSVPADGETLTVGLTTYTWRTFPSVAGDIQIGANTTDCAENLRDTLAGGDGRMTAANNVLRYITDVFNNKYATTYGETNGNIVVIVSWSDFTLSKTGTAVTLTAPADYRQAVLAPIGVNLCVAPLVTGNLMDDCPGGIAAQQNYFPSFFDNVFTGQASSLAPFACYGNIRSHYRGNRLVELQLLQQGQQYYSHISDAFPIIEDHWIVNQQDTYPEVGNGKTGVISVGDGKGVAYFYYGMELNTAVQDASTKPYRWEDGDTLQMWQGGAFLNYKFKRNSPSAGSREFNTADGLIALINADGVFTASYASFTNDLAGADPKLMIKFKLASAGVVNSSWYFQLLRFKDPAGVPGDPVDSVAQPLITGQFLRNPQDADPEKGRFYGGAATAIKTFVHTPLANKNRPVFVQGVDATSRALNPYVDQADIIPGVGFTITHSVAGGTEKFAWSL